MKQYTAPVIFIGLAVLVAVLLMPYTAEPEIYAISNIEEAGVFKNPIALKQISQEKTADLQPLMQDFFDTSGTIVLNVRLKNFEDAEEDLEEYRRAAKQFDHMVINLDMSESEIGEFRKNNADNLRNLEELLNDSLAFDELSQLEIQYRDADDPAKMYAIAYEGEALREKISQEFAQYTNHTTAMAKTGKNLETDPEPMESSVAVFEEYISEITGVQEERVEQTTEKREKTEIIQEDLTLTIDPSSGTYGDVLNTTGIFSRTGDIPKGEPVTLYIDSREYAATSCTSTGEYTIPISIRKMYAGIHLAYTRAGDVFSPLVPFTVSATEGVLTLNVSVQGDIAFASGTLHTEGRVVPDAPVIVSFVSADTQNMTTVYTDDTGAYSCATKLTPGEYTVQSVFSDTAYPVSECRSEEHVIEIAQSYLIVYLILFVCCAGGAGYLFLRRMRDGKEEGKPLSDLDETTDEGEYQSPTAPIESKDEKREHRTSDPAAINNYRTRYLSERDDLTSVQAARILGEGLTTAIAQYTAQKYRPSETMREQTARLDEHCRHPAYLFVTMYEAVVYGMMEPEGDELLSAWDTAIQCMGDA